MSTNWPFSPGRGIDIVRADGAYLYTRSGDALLDAAGGAIVVNIGHGVRSVVDAVAKATLETTYVVPPWLTPARQAMVEALEAHWLTPGLRRIHATSGGSEAVESAIKLALMYHAARGDAGRTQIITREVSYHGTTLATVAASGHPARRRGLDHAVTPYPTTHTPSTLHCPLGAHHPDAGQFYVDELERRIEALGPETVAAFLAEPITGSSGGAIVPPDDYWPKVRELCDRHGILLIHDEVMCAFGRTGKPFGHQHWPIEPDILVGGKGLAGGYAPLGCVFATEAIGAAIDAAGYNMMFHTFGAHPAACAAAAEVLNILVRDDLVARSARLGSQLTDRLNNAFSNHPHVAEVRGRGLLQAIEVVADRDPHRPYPLEDQIANRIVARGLENGVFFYGGGTGEFRDVVCMEPPFIIDETHLDQMTGTLLDAVNHVTGVAA